MHPGGRPPLFDTPEELQRQIDSYFMAKEAAKQTITITALAFWLGFESRQSLYDYEKKEEFSYIIKRARLRVEIGYEERLDSKNPTGAIFALKNMGWKDKQEIDQNTSLQAEIKHTIDHSKLSEATLREIAGLDKPTESAD